MSVRTLRWVLLACSGAACLGVAALAVHTARPDAPSPRVSLEPAVIEGFRTASYEGGRLRMRLSGDSLTLTHPKLIGPFRLGFVHAVMARNATVEIFPTGGGSADSTAAASLAAIPALLQQGQGRLDIAEAEVAPIKVMEHRDGEAKVILSAASCAARLISAAVVCKDGVIEREGATIHFRELTYEPRSKTLRTTP